MKRLTYSRENMDNPWSMVANDSQVEEALANRESLQEEGVKNLKEFEFWVRPEDYRPCLVRGEYVLEFSRLGWSRFQKTFGLTHDFVNARLKGGDTGLKMLEGFVNDTITKERRLLLLYRHVSEGNTYTVRDMVRVKDREVDARVLWEHLKHVPPTLGNGFQDPELIAVRLSDYAHQFRYLFPRVDDDSPGIMIDCCLSMGRRLFYAQGLYWWPGQDGVIRVARLDMAEVDSKEFFVEADLMAEAVTEVWHKLMEFADTWTPWCADVPDRRETSSTMGLLIRAFKSRTLAVKQRTPILREVHRIAAGRTHVGTEEVLGILSRFAWEHLDPETSNRIERIVYDLASGRVSSYTENDRKAAERWSKERPAIIPGGTRQLPELSPSSISEGE